jgi:phage portal protein BeeE
VNLLRHLAKPAEEKRSTLSLSFDQWVESFKYNGLSYNVPRGTLGGKAEEITPDFPGLIAGAYRTNGVVFACMLVRALLFSEARFQFRGRRNGRPGDLFGTPALELLESPWVNGTTGNLLTRMMQDADLDGNFYATRLPDRSAPAGSRVQRLRPDWVTIVLGSNSLPDDPGAAYDAELVGYIYSPGGRTGKHDPLVFLPEEVAHFNPIPDPMFRFRGMSWLTPVIREVMGDGAATDHKLRYFENGATPNMVVSLDSDITPEKFQAWVDKFEDRHEGLQNAYKTLYLGGGATATPVGSDMQQVDFKVTQGHGETRIAAAAGVPPVIVGLSEGLQAATYSNYSQARRRFADGTMRPLWREAAGTLAKLVDVPRGAELWYDDRDIAFLREDQKDAADIQQTDAISIKQLIEAGFTAASAVAAITAGDLTLLEHSGLVSVQLQEPGSANAGVGSPVVPEPAA